MSTRESIKLEQEFYDRRWKAFGLTALERERIALTTSLVPVQCGKVLDIGCGDGRVSTELHEREKCTVIAFDLSLVALAGLSLPSCCGLAQQLPFPDKSFDLVMATEILEHIPSANYSSVLQEMERVARKHILITVPNDEDLNECVSTCGTCSSRFHAWGHMRFYKASFFRTMFPGFRLTQLRSFGGKEPRYNRLLLDVRQRVAGGWYWEQHESCHACGSSIPMGVERPFLARVCDALNVRFWAPFFKRDRWLVALYERRKL